MDGQRLLSVPDVADRWGMKTARIYELVASKRLRAKRIGRLLRFGEDDLQRFLDRNSTIKD